MRRVLSVRAAWCVLAAWACLAPRPAAAGLIIQRNGDEAFLFTAGPEPAAPAAQPAAAGPASAPAPTPLHGVPNPPAGLLAALGGLLVVAAARWGRHDRPGGPLLPA